MQKWKHIILSLGILSLIIIIGGTTWYITIIRPKTISEPVVIYNVKEPKPAENTTDTLPVKTSEKKYNIQADDTEVNKHQNGVSQSNIVQEKNTSTQTKQKSDEKRHAAETHQHSKEDLEKWAKEIKELEDREKVIHEKLAYVKADLRNIEKRSQRRLSEKANRLNSLSVEEQQAYFDNMRNGAAEIPSDYFQSIRNTAQSSGIPDTITNIFLKHFTQIIRESFSEEGVREHVEELRAHGFNPKY